jgi:hypothetical protein
MVLNHSCPNHPRHLVVRYERQAENYPGLGMVGLRDDSTQALLKRSLACSVPTATAVARLHAALYSPLLRVSVMASSRGSAWAPCPRRRKRVFPKCPAGCSHGTVVLGALNRWEGPAPILAQRGGCSTKPRYPFHPLLCDRYSGQPLQAKQDGMLEAHPPSSQLQALFIQPPRPCIFACFARHASEADERAHDAPRVLRATRQSQALFQQHSRASEISLPAHRGRNASPIGCRAYLHRRNRTLPSAHPPTRRLPAERVGRTPVVTKWPERGSAV